MAKRMSHPEAIMTILSTGPKHRSHVLQYSSGAERTAMCRLIEDNEVIQFGDWFASTKWLRENRKHPSSVAFYAQRISEKTWEYYLLNGFSAGAVEQGLANQIKYLNEYLKIITAANYKLKGGAAVIETDEELYQEGMRIYTQQSADRSGAFFKTPEQIEEAARKYVTWRRAETKREQMMP